MSGLSIKRELNVDLAIQFPPVHTIAPESSRNLHLLPIENSLARISPTERTVA